MSKKRYGLAGFDYVEKPQPSEKKEDPEIPVQPSQPSPAPEEKTSDEAKDVTGSATLSRLDLSKYPKKK